MKMLYALSSILVLYSTISVISGAGNTSPHECTCSNNCRGYPREALVQCRGFISSNHIGNTKFVAMGNVKKSGMTLDGYVCGSKCSACYADGRYCCKPVIDKKIHPTPVPCAPYNSDNHGRKCVNVSKNTYNTATCVVQGHSNFGPFESQRGKTHPPLCAGTQKVCIVK